MRRSILELGPRSRLVFAVVYALVMTGVIVSAQFRPDHAFGFQMFNQSSTIQIALFRKVRGQRRTVPVVDGAWEAVDRAGVRRTFRWQDRVNDSVLRTLDRPVHARYGLEGQVFRLEQALNDVLEHVPDDMETTALIAEVSGSKNGRAPELVKLRAKRR